MGHADRAAPGARNLHALREHPEMLAAQFAALDGFVQLADLFGEPLQSLDVSQDLLGRVDEFPLQVSLRLGDGCLDVGALHQSVSGVLGASWGIAGAPGGSGRVEVLDILQDEPPMPRVHSLAALLHLHHLP